MQDLPKAIVCHELMGYVMLGLTWTACYHFPISDIPFLKGPMDRLTSMVPAVLSNPVNNNPFLCSKFGKAYMESACLRKLIRPITLPGKLFLTYKMVQILPDIELPSFCLPAKFTDCTAYQKVHGDLQDDSTDNNDYIEDSTVKSALAPPSALSNAMNTSDHTFCSYKEGDTRIRLSEAFRNDGYIKLSDLENRYKPLDVQDSVIFANRMSRI